MKLSEFIELLEGIKAEYGDQDVVVYDDMCPTGDDYGMNPNFTIGFDNGRVEICPE